MSNECQLCDNSEGILGPIALVLIFACNEEELRPILLTNRPKCCLCDESLYNFVNYIINENITDSVEWERGVIVSYDGTFVQVIKRLEDIPIEVPDLLN